MLLWLSGQHLRHSILRLQYGGLCKYANTLELIMQSVHCVSAGLEHAHTRPYISYVLLVLKPRRVSDARRSFSIIHDGTHLNYNIPPNCGRTQRSDDLLRCCSCCCRCWFGCCCYPKTYLCIRIYEYEMSSSTSLVHLLRLDCWLVCRRRRRLCRAYEECVVRIMRSRLACCRLRAVASANR